MAERECGDASAFIWTACAGPGFAGLGFIEDGPALRRTPIAPVTLLDGNRPILSLAQDIQEQRISSPGPLMTSARHHHVVRGIDLFEFRRFRFLPVGFAGSHPAALYTPPRFILNDDGKRLAKSDDARAISVISERRRVTGDYSFSDRALRGYLSIHHIKAVMRSMRLRQPYKNRFAPCCDTRPVWFPGPANRRGRNRCAVKPALAQWPLVSPLNPERLA